MPYYPCNDPTYISYLETLNFQVVQFEDKREYSNLGFCHRDCENYTKAHAGVQIYGWLKQPWGNGFRYLLHSCVEENGQLKNLTPAGIPPSNLFSADPRIVIDHAVTDEFRFLDQNTGNQLPRYFEAT